MFAPFTHTASHVSNESSFHESDSEEEPSTPPPPGRQAHFSSRFNSVRGRGV